MAKREIVYTGEAARLDEEVKRLQQQLNETIKQRDAAYKEQVAAEKKAAADEKKVEANKRKDAKEAVAKAMAENSISADDVMAFLNSKKNNA